MPRRTDSGRQTPDLLALPVLGRFLGWRHARTALQLPLLLLAGLMVFDGLTGPQLAPKNLATVLTWVHYRGLVVVVLLLVGNLFCMACPFMLVRNLAPRRPRLMWPRRLRNKWLAVALFALFLFVYEFFDLWAVPRWTAWLIIGYFVTALVIDSLFRGAAFCKYLCPLGQFNFVASTISPLEVQTRTHATCATCRTKDCIRGRPEGPADRTQQALRGCELWLYQPAKLGNIDCTFCLDCAHACPHDNVGISARLPASELWRQTRRSSLGYLSRRPDLAALAIAFSFGALLNAFAMVSPVYAVEDWLAGMLRTQSELPVLVILFVAGLVVLPATLLGATAWVSRRLVPSESRRSIGAWVTRYAYALVPLGFGVWLAHYGFHFLTGFWTLVPVSQSFAADMVGSPLLGAPRWELGPLLPRGWLYPLELGFLALGWFGSLLVAHQLAEQDAGPDAWRAALPWAVLLTILFAFAIWLMGQPMEMRGTLFMG